LGSFNPLEEEEKVCFLCLKKIIYYPLEATSRNYLIPKSKSGWKQK
jgi:hypothetical protein